MDLKEPQLGGRMQWKKAVFDGRVEGNNAVLMAGRAERNPVGWRDGMEKSMLNGRMEGIMPC